VIPESPFGFGESSPQLLRAIPGYNVPLQASPSPCPLPLKGERDSSRHLLNSIESVQTVNA
jgi:hypothetical protein